MNKESEIKKTLGIPEYIYCENFQPIPDLLTLLRVDIFSKKMEFESIVHRGRWFPVYESSHYHEAIEDVYGNK
jgi:hypothetical protein